MAMATAGASMMGSKSTGAIQLEDFSTLSGTALKKALSQSHPTLPPPPAPPRHWVPPKKAKSISTWGVAKVGSESTAKLKNLENAVKDLDAQILADEKSLNEMNRNIETWQLAADRLQRKIDEEVAIVEAMSPDRGLGQAIKQFDGYMTDVKRTYKHLRGKHKDNIDILRKEFNYTPAYKTAVKKGGGYPFNAVYHTMAKDPAKLPVS
mmetsp:Transcript_108601/g.188614  ORF Transcript_108601/g.188614 Transcript_108601/m.188614 type:complete len:208 (-) Transcript_108601:18-641(-)